MDEEFIFYPFKSYIVFREKLVEEPQSNKFLTVMSVRNFKSVVLRFGLFFHSNVSRTRFTFLKSFFAFEIGLFNRNYRTFQN